MIALNLEAKSKEQEIIKAYLEENASETLTDKINDGVTIEKDGKRLLNRKTLDGFMSYACEEAKKQTSKDTRGACIEDKTVYGWAIHYFEEDTIEGTLYNEDGTEYNPKPQSKTPTAVTKKPADKPQATLFDFMDDSAEAKEVKTETVTTETATKTDTAENDEDPLTEEEMQEILREFAEEDAKQHAELQEEKPNGSPLYQRYLKLQQTYPDAIIAMRFGDFYEVFGEKAVMLADELNMTLTGRDFGLPERVPVIGFPYHAVDMYIRKISENHLIALCETLDDYKLYPSQEKNTVIDLETGEILTEEEMREFDGDIEEPKDLLNDESDYSDPSLTRKLTALIGNIYIVR